MTGTTWIEESGAVDVPILITNTHAVGAVHEGVIDWIGRRYPLLAAGGCCRSSPRPGTAT